MKFQHLHPSSQSHEHTDSIWLIHTFALHPCYRHIMCVQMCHMKYFTFLAIVYHIINFFFVCCRALTNSVVFWNPQTALWVYLPPHTQLVFTVCFVAGKRKCPPTLTDGAPVCFLSASQIKKKKKKKQATVSVPMRTDQPMQKLEGF